MAGRGRPQRDVERSSILLRMPTDVLEQVETFKERLEAERGGFTINRTDLLVRLIEVGLQTLTQARQPTTQPAPAVPETRQDNHTVIQKAAPKGPGRPGGLREPILDLVREHPEGLRADQIKVFLGTDRNIGDTLQGMLRGGVLQKQGSGKEMRYLAVPAPRAPRQPTRPAPPRARARATGRA